MAVFVADASVALAWCFADETTAWTETLLDRLDRGDRLAVPAHWFSEISNGLWMAARRKRILLDQTAAIPTGFLCCLCA
jgi:predicted nucleic acid-binding protein